MLFRLAFLIFIFSTIVTSVAKADNSNPSHNPNIIIITVALTTIEKTDNSIITPIALPKNKLKNPNPLPIVKTPVKSVNKDYSHVINQAYIKLEKRYKKNHNRAEKKWRK